MADALPKFQVKIAAENLFDEAWLRDSRMIEDEQFIVTTDPAAVHAVRGALESHGMHVGGSEIAWLPKTTVRVEGKTAESLIRLLEEIDELDDVQKVDANFDMDVADMASA